MTVYLRMKVPIFCRYLHARFQRVFGTANFRPEVDERSISLENQNEYLARFFLLNAEDGAALINRENMALLPPPNSWSFDLPPRLKLAIADTIDCFVRLVCVGCPEFVKFGRRVFYRRGVLETFVAASTVRTSAYGQRE